MDKVYFDQKFNSIEEKLNRKFDAIDRRFEAIDKRFEQIDKRLDHQDARIDKIEKIMEVGFSNMITLQNKMYADLSTQIDRLALYTAQGFKDINSRLEKLEFAHAE